MARQLEIEITESAEYLEKTLKQARSASQNIGCAVVVQNRTCAMVASEPA
ncbi:MAG: hypothetical protein HWQ23_08810 [Nostoc sp. JL33]|nr:hypothetical protein [Nostoc sp. JL33]MBN3870373.1 hypothetical protein [Nostoc sp. JL33]